MTEERLTEIERALSLIQQRNEKVETDKAWETSKTRIASICLVTYVVAATIMYLLGADRYWLNAFVPVVGFYLSSRSLPEIKHWWIATVYGKQKKATD